MDFDWSDVFMSDDEMYNEEEAIVCISMNYRIGLKNDRV